MDIYRALLAESMKKDKINLSDLEYVYGDHALTKKFNDLHNRLEETRKSVISQHPNLSIDDQEDLVATLFQSSYLIDKEKTVEKQHNEVQAELERKVEEIPIEEFDNDTQDYREEYLKKFGK
jgi:hypothetical protein